LIQIIALIDIISLTRIAGFHKLFIRLDSSPGFAAYPLSIPLAELDSYHSLILEEFQLLNCGINLRGRGQTNLAVTTKSTGSAFAPVIVNRKYFTESKKKFIRTGLENDQNYHYEIASNLQYPAYTWFS
jgi:hypothetical protein